MCYLVLLVKDVVKFLEGKFPPSLAYDWDNIGLQLGDVNSEVSNVMVALDATTLVIDEAINKNIDLIITHHPFIFSPLKSIDFTTPQGKNIQKLIKNDIAIYAMHTNYDIAPSGMNDVLAEKIGLQGVKPFAVIDDVHGLGRIGKLEGGPQFLLNWIRIFKDKLGLSTVNYAHGNIPMIENIAIIGGSGGKYIHEAKAAGADTLITGDLDYHTAIEVKEIGLNIIDIGHYAEVVMEENVAALLDDQFSNDVQISLPSESENPIVFRIL